MLGRVLKEGRKGGREWWNGGSYEEGKRNKGGNERDRRRGRR